MTCTGPRASGEQPSGRYVSLCQSAETVKIWLFDRDGSLATTLQERGGQRRVGIPLPALVQALAATGAAYVFMAHNHPSGDPRPSDADIEATRQVWRIARMLGASLQDHLVIAQERCFSFRSHGLL
ncbi:MAG: JAB domain-containing protein [Sphingobium sp.]